MASVAVGAGPAAADCATEPGAAGGRGWRQWAGERNQWGLAGKARQHGALGLTHRGGGLSRSLLLGPRFPSRPAQWQSLLWAGGCPTGSYLPFYLPLQPPPDMRSGKHGTAGPGQGGIAVPRSSSPWVVSFLEAWAVGEAAGERGIEEGSRGEEGSEVRGFRWQRERPRLGGGERGFPR